MVLVCVLIKAGADKNRVVYNEYTGRNKTPLYIAIENSHEALTRALIMGAADVRAENDLNLEEAAENDSWTPLCIAAHKGHEAMVWALIDADADVNK